MEPCTAPTFSRASQRDCSCRHASETQPVRIFAEHRSVSLYAPVGIGPNLAQEDLPSGLLVVLFGAAALTWTRQRLGARIVELHLARPVPERGPRWRRPRLVLSGRERRAFAALRELFEHASRPALAPVPAAISRRPDR